jgi:hypothetical protein
MADALKWCRNRASLLAKAFGVDFIDQLGGCDHSYDFHFHGCFFWRCRSSSRSIASFSSSKSFCSAMTSWLPGPQPLLHYMALAAKRYSVCCL